MKGRMIVLSIVAMVPCYNACTKPVDIREQNMAITSVQCRVINGQVDDLGVDHPMRYKCCTPLPLRQFWHGPEKFPSEDGTAYVGATEEFLVFYACFQDSDIFSHATDDNQKMWELGDVAEFFIKPENNQTDYWEIHVTPNDFMLDLHIPDRDQFFSGGVSWEQVSTPNSHAIKRVAVMDGKWSVELSIPWGTFGLHSPPPRGSVWRIAICRYNYNGGMNQPEHSSTAALTKLNFHQHENYMKLNF